MMVLFLCESAENADRIYFYRSPALAIAAESPQRGTSEDL